MSQLISAIKKIFSVLNIFALVTILVTTFFYIGSKEQFEEIILNSLYMFILGKLSLNFFIILFYISIDFLFNKFLFLDKESKYIFLNSMIVLNVFSTIFITVFLYISIK
jgi:hypothetical protein